MGGGEGNERRASGAGAVPAEGMAGMTGHIAQVAARLFATRGYDATSVREIVEAAGVTKPTLYYHFGSKEGLGQALVVRPLEGLVGQLREALDAGEGSRETMERVIEAHFAFCREDPERSRFVYALLFGPLGAGLASEIARFTTALQALLTEAVERLVEERLLARERAEDFLCAVRGAIVVRTLDYLYQNHDLPPELPGRLVGDLMRGFAMGADGKGARR